MLAQEDELKQLILIRISYHYSFAKYTRSDLPSSSREETDKLDLLSNKNAKHLRYKFNDWIESMVAEKFWSDTTRKLETRSVFKK